MAAQLFTSDNVAELINLGSCALVDLNSFVGNCFTTHSKIEPIKSKLREFQAVVNRANTFAKGVVTSPEVRSSIDIHAGICTENITKLKLDLDQHTAQNCWASGANTLFRDATLTHANRVTVSLAALGLNCNIALKSFKRCNVITSGDS
ncbi:hypothetical protein SGCOL_010495 [Colletotrichum sp. CLE4]